MRARELAPALGTTVHYLPQVLSPLVHAGWLHSEPGPTGGYRLAEGYTSRTLLELIELIEGPIATDKCVLKGGLCDSRNPCEMHAAWLQVRTALEENLARIPVSGVRKGTKT